MTVTYDEQFLLSGSEDGCLLMWKLMDQDGRGPAANRQIVHAEEILVTKADLEEKVRTCAFHLRSCFSTWGLSPRTRTWRK